MNFKVIWLYDVDMDLWCGVCKVFDREIRKYDLLNYFRECVN